MIKMNYSGNDYKILQDNINRNSKRGDSQPVPVRLLQQPDTITLNINPHTKPRMVASDKYKKRKCVSDYWNYKYALNLQVKDSGWQPTDTLKLTFIIQMPDSWNKKKKELMNGKPHQQTPDCDNITKAFKDCLYTQDCVVWAEDCKKLWGYEGKIIIDNYLKTENVLSEETKQDIANDINSREIILKRKQIISKLPLT